MYIADIQQDMRNFFILPCLLVGRNQQKSLQYSQSCSSSKSILQPKTSQSCSLTLTVLGFKTYGMTPRKAAKVTPKRVFRLGKHDFPVFRRVRESVCRSAVMILLWQVRQTTTIWVSLALHAVPTCRTAQKAGVREAGEYESRRQTPVHSVCLLPVFSATFFFLRAR